MSSTSIQSTTPRCRVRELLPDLWLGRFAPGPKNSLTDVEGVLVHTQSIHEEPNAEHGPVHTGVTTILPRKEFFHKACYAGMFRLNGSGEMTGSHWIEETGLLHTPIVLTNSFSVGAAYQGIYEYCIPLHKAQPGGEVDWFMLPVVGETFDGFMNDIGALKVTPAHIVHGIQSVSADPVPEGNTGGGTGMLCHWFKGGTGSASRRVPAHASAGVEHYTIGVLVQANYGGMQDLRIGGAPFGRHYVANMQKAAAEKDAAATERVQAVAAIQEHKDKKDGSIIIIVATDAPLHPLQLQRLAKRCSIGLARVGGNAYNPSGDIFLAFSTANEIPVQSEADPWTPTPLNIQVLDDTTINALFAAAADATEESIYNALCMAETMTGVRGKTVEALPLDKVKEYMQKYL